MFPGREQPAKQQTWWWCSPKTQVSPFLINYLDIFTWFHFFPESSIFVFASFLFANIANFYRKPSTCNIAWVVADLVLVNSRLFNISWGWCWLLMMIIYLLLLIDFYVEYDDLCFNIDWFWRWGWSFLTQPVLKLTHVKLPFNQTNLIFGDKILDPIESPNSWCTCD